MSLAIIGTPIGLGAVFLVDNGRGYPGVPLAVECLTSALMGQFEHIAEPRVSDTSQSSWSEDEQGWGLKQLIRGINRCGRP